MGMGSRAPVKMILSLVLLCAADCRSEDLLALASYLQQSRQAILDPEQRANNPDGLLQLAYENDARLLEAIVDMLAAGRTLAQIEQDTSFFLAWREWPRNVTETDLGEINYHGEERPLVLYRCIQCETTTVCVVAFSFLFETSRGAPVRCRLSVHALHLQAQTVSVHRLAGSTLRTLALITSNEGHFFLGFVPMEHSLPEIILADGPDGSASALGWYRFRYTTQGDEWRAYESGLLWPGRRFTYLEDDCTFVDEGMAYSDEFEGGTLKPSHYIYQRYNLCTGEETEVRLPPEQAPTATPTVTPTPTM